MGKTAQMQALLEQKQRMVAEIERLKHQLEGLEMAISVLKGENTAIIRKPSVKETVLRLLDEHKTVGLSAQETVELAEKHGEKLGLASVSSLLSRLKREGVLRLEGSKYMIGETSKPLDSNENPKEGQTGDRLRVVS